MNIKQEKTKSVVDWKTILVSNLATLIVTIIASYSIYYFTREKPKLRYEQSPISSFISTQNKTSIVSIRIENTGDKEAEDVVLDFKFSEYILIKESITDLSYLPIDHTVKVDTSLNKIRYSFPILNPGEKCNFSFLLSSRMDSLKTSDVDVSLRGKGVNGIPDYKEDPVISKHGDIIESILLLGISTLMVYLIIAIYIRLYKVTNPSKEDKSEDSLEIAVDYCDMGLFDDSIHILKKAIYIDPNNSPLHSNVARAYANKGMFSIAFDELKIASNLISDDADKFVNDYVTSQVYSLHDDEENTIKFFKAAISYDKDRAQKKALSDTEFLEVRNNEEFKRLLNL